MFGVVNRIKDAATVKGSQTSNERADGRDQVRSGDVLFNGVG